MPAIEMNSYADDYDIDQPTQQALFKLWLIMTTNPWTVRTSSKFFETTLEADTYKMSQVNSARTTYYLDIEKLATELQPLTPGEVSTIVTDLTQNQRPFIIQAADVYISQAKDPGDYPPGGNCVSICDVLGNQKKCGSPLPGAAAKKAATKRKRKP